MRTSPKKLVTIVAPESSEGELVDALRGMGALGCSIIRAHGHGVHGARPNHWSGGGLEWHGPNVQVEVVVDGRSVDCLLDLLEKRNEVYGPFVAWISNVDAWPVERFSK